jgi:ketosteroid isomerase-like protein
MDPDAFARSWLGAFNARDVDAITAHYAETIEHSSPTVVRLLGEPSGVVRGKAALRAYFVKALDAAGPGLHYDLQRVYVGAHGVTILYHRSGGTAGARAEDTDGGGAPRAPEAPSRKLVAETFHFDAAGLVARAFVAHAEA